MIRSLTLLLGVAVAAADIALQDIFVTQTLTRTYYTCPCDHSISYDAWQTFSNLSTSTNEPSASDNSKTALTAWSKSPTFSSTSTSPSISTTATVSTKTPIITTSSLVTTTSETTTTIFDTTTSFTPLSTISVSTTSSATSTTTTTTTTTSTPTTTTTSTTSTPTTTTTTTSTPTTTTTTTTTKISTAPRSLVTCNPADAGGGSLNLGGCMGGCSCDYDIDQVNAYCNDGTDDGVACTSDTDCQATEFCDVGEQGNTAGFCATFIGCSSNY